MEGPTVARGEQLWQPYMVRGTIGGAVVGPVGPLAARTTYGVTHLRQHTYVRINISMYNKMHGYAVSYFNLKAPRLF